MSDSEDRRSPEWKAQRAAISAILEEREYQKKRWSPAHDKQHTPESWQVILAVWLGKLAQETPLYQGEGYYDPKKFLKRLAQIGAITAAAYEALSELQASSDTK